MDKYTILSESDGSVNVNASVANYASALGKWVEANEIDSAAVLHAIDQVFDGQASGARLTSPILVSYTMAVLKPETSQFSAIENRIRAIVKGSPRFDSAKGKGGGVRRNYKEGEAAIMLPVKQKKSA